MKLLLLFFLLEYLDFAPLPAADANAKFSQNDLYILREASIIRGNYKDVASQFNGALLSSARKTIFWTLGIENSPLRNLLYYYPPDPNLHQGHVVARLGESIIVEFLQAYEINTVRFWMWDNDDRQTDIQVLTIAADRRTEKFIYDGNAQAKILPIQKSSSVFILIIKKINCIHLVKLEFINFKMTLHVVKLSDQLVSGLKFYNRGGNSLDHQYMSIIKIQAFYAF
ncbi:unnamed protein product [Paramecium pentaurelia]|uniref:Uncharacterized protein n=1 Tax=Paramecium pentaurelia TaxID=43138 RepID=A0A8S1YDK6_9CILI|nr:unnamed protein product [Paramecium pentaurelia]